MDDRCSRSGCLLLLNGGPVSWISRKWTCTASSTTETEYIAACLAGKEVVWMRRLLAKLVFLNQLRHNPSAIRLNPEFHRRTKHIDVQFHMIRDFHQQGHLLISYICTANQLADILTKPLVSDNFTCRRSLLGVTLMNH